MKESHQINTLLKISTLVLALSQPVIAQEDDTQDPPHAFPREGAIQVFDNPWGTAWNVTWTPFKPTPLHKHAYDYVGVELVNSSFKLSVPGQQPQTIPINMGSSYFLPKGSMHVEEGLSSNPPRHAVLIDLKDVPTVSYENTTSYPLAFPRISATKIAENQRVIMWDYIWTPDQTSAMYFYDKASFVMIVTGGELSMSSSDSPSQILNVSPGQVLFNPGGSARAEQAIKDAVRAIIVELK